MDPNVTVVVIFKILRDSMLMMMRHYCIRLKAMVMQLPKKKKLALKYMHDKLLNKQTQAQF
jgi:hypothetical protein